MFRLEIFLTLLFAAFLSGVGTWLLGRPLRHAAQDPALVEKLERHRKWLMRLVIGLAVFFPQLMMLLGYGESGLFDGTLQFILSIALILAAAGLGGVVGNFPLRRTLFEEKWNVFEYVAHLFQIAAATFGYWLLILGTPFLILVAGSWRWGAAGALFVVLIVWGHFYNTIMPSMLGARPLDDRPLLQRFDQILARSTAKRPRILCAGNEKGSWCNAFALPDVKRPGVLFSRPLLAHLDPDEATAVFAHEVAHLEDFDEAKLQQHSRHQLLLIVAACLAPPLLITFGGLTGTLFLWA